MKKNPHETLAADQSALTVLKLAELVESKHNARRSFDSAKMKELVESIAIHGVLSPILVRPLGKGYEIVAGARRFRAARTAKLETLPCVVRTLDDKEALEVNLIENLQRADLEPLEEADGYLTLTKKHGYSAEQLATKIGKSIGYVYGRLKLCELAPGVKKMVADKTLDMSLALLVARIPDVKLSEKAAKEIVSGFGNGEAMSWRRASEHIQSSYMLRLKDAPFDTGDKTLVPAAGACGPCPKRSGNQRGLFDDVQGKSNELCTDGACFKSKCDAWWQREAAKAKDKGVQVLEGKEADKAADPYSGKSIDLDRKAYDIGQHDKTYRQLLGKSADVDQQLARTSRGEVKQLAPRDQVMAALKDKGLMVPKKPASNGVDKKHKAAHDLRKKAIALTLEDLVEKAEAASNEKKFARFVVEALLREEVGTAQDVGARRGVEFRKGGGGFGVSTAGERYLDSLTAAQLRGLVVELIAVSDATAMFRATYGDGWLAACELAGIDMKKREELVKKGAAEKAGQKKAAKAAAK
jgi:ParB/RepB/Spo0J family partition protein